MNEQFDRLLSEAEAAEYLNVSRPYLRLSRMNGFVGSGNVPAPPYVKMGRAVRYRKADLDQWIESNLVKD